MLADRLERIKNQLNSEVLSLQTKVSGIHGTGAEITLYAIKVEIQMLDDIIKELESKPVKAEVEEDLPNPPTNIPTLQGHSSNEDTRSYNIGVSDYSKHEIQPWDIWLEYNLNPWDADIVKRILRKKHTDGRRLDYEKIIHICKERLRQIDAGYE